MCGGDTYTVLLASWRSIFETSADFSVVWSPHDPLPPKSELDKPAFDLGMALQHAVQAAMPLSLCTHRPHLDAVPSTQC